MTKYLVRPMFLGLLFKVVVHADNYDRGISSIHFSRVAAELQKNYMNRNNR